MRCVVRPSRMTLGLAVIRYKKTEYPVARIVRSPQRRLCAESRSLSDVGFAPHKRRAKPFTDPCDRYRSYGIVSCAIGRAVVAVSRAGRSIGDGRPVGFSPHTRGGAPCMGPCDRSRPYGIGCAIDTCRCRQDGARKLMPLLLGVDHSWLRRCVSTVSPRHGLECDVSGTGAHARFGEQHGTVVARACGSTHCATAWKV